MVQRYFSWVKRSTESLKLSLEINIALEVKYRKRAPAESKCGFWCFVMSCIRTWNAHCVLVKRSQGLAWRFAFLWILMEPKQILFSVSKAKAFVSNYSGMENNFSAVQNISSHQQVRSSGSYKHSWWKSFNEATLHWNAIPPGVLFLILRSQRNLHRTLPRKIQSGATCSVWITEVKVCLSKQGRQAEISKISILLS